MSTGLIRTLCEAVARRLPVRTFEGTSGPFLSKYRRRFSN